MKNKVVTGLLVTNDLDAILITSKVNRYWYYTNFPPSLGYLLITRTQAFLLLYGSLTWKNSLTITKLFHKYAFNCSNQSGQLS
ncbi:hypothetical protein P344_05130 [Spiroplasma mirum ATCC 29335]|uniref:Creatinase N-terminal domain-containing protein n=1 Tax=Spiroplasma mirum ATCC 29335 TaxID=838561 RepID=W0GRR9_9MOLU|nr:MULTISPECIES: hypothetical protein [Spiroplasma]AHF61246.1 C-terminal truncated Xaa-Pro dipeptidase [Spiroplasma mirum ATCC 29335]AHI58348.1 hypothetical protein P344_05130 [Spiroplasma mirum ATCC 29335]